MKHTQLLITTARPPNKPSWTNRGKIFDAGHTNSDVLNFGVTESTLIKLLSHVEKWETIID